MVDRQLDPLFHLSKPVAGPNMGIMLSCYQDCGNHLTLCFSSFSTEIIYKFDIFFYFYFDVLAPFFKANWHPMAWLQVRLGKDPLLGDAFKSANMKNFSRWQLELGMSMVNGQMVCLVAFRTKGDLSIGSLMAHHLAKQMHRQPRPHPLNSCSTNVLLHVSIYIYIHTYIHVYIHICVCI